MNKNELLNKILLARTDCWQFSLKKIRQYNKPIITFSLNIPGILKNNVQYTKFFNKYYKEFLKFIINYFTLIYEFSTINYVGNYGWVVINEQNALKIKSFCCKFEKIFKNISSLIDIDVYDINEFKISRKKPRKCYLCENNAKVCTRMQVHTYIELQKYIFKIINSDLS